MEQQFINVKEAADMLDVSSCRVAVLCREGRIIGARKIGRDWVIPNPPRVAAGSRSRPGKISVEEKKSQIG